MNYSDAPFSTRSSVKDKNDKVYESWEAELTVLARLLPDLVLLKLERVCSRRQDAVLADSRVVSAFYTSDAISPMVSDKLGPPLDETLHLLLLNILIHLFFGLFGVFQALAWRLKPGLSRLEAFGNGAGTV